jgi:hypothetical protein
MSMHKPLALTLAALAVFSACQSADDTHEDVHPRQDNPGFGDGSDCFVFGQILINGKRDGEWCCGEELCTDEAACGDKYGEYVESCYVCNSGFYECGVGEPTGNEPEPPDDTCYDGFLDQHAICYGDLTTLATDEAPGSVVVTDVDRDGVPDVLATSLATVNVFLQPLSEETTPSVFPLDEASFALALADLDGDGDDDIAAATDNAGLTVLTNDGAGGFSDPAVFELPANAAALAFADLRGEGNLDIVATIPERDSLTTWFHGFGDSVTQGLDGDARSPGAVAATDLDGDGDIDVITANAMSGSISALLNDGDGSSFSEQHVFGVGPHPGALALGDVNRDGTTDLVVADGASVGVLLGSGDAQLFLDPGEPRNFTAGGEPRSIALVDVNADDALDIVAANTEAGNLALLVNEGEGTFAAPRLFRAGPQPVAVAAGDINQDGAPDFAVSYAEPPRVLVFSSTP